MTSGDTIVAVSSAVGPAPRMTVRLSGPDASNLARAIGASTPHIPSSASHESLKFCNLSVPAWVYQFSAPGSYTGEDLIEFHLPGNPLLVQMLLKELIRLGARSAVPGEFTARAYFNGRLDLTEAEGVAATIAAGNEQELSAARQLLGGELARRLTPLMNLLADTLALLEVGIDFSEEDVTFLAADQVRSRITRVDDSLAKLLSESSRFERIAHEPGVVLVGRPNAGKSTLLNALSGFERAVVSAVAGTTRDAISAQVTLRRGTVRVVDVAGVEDIEAGSPAIVTTKHREVEQKMHQQALRAVETADVLLFVRDSTDQRPHLLLGQTPDLVVHSKHDLRVGEIAQDDELFVSALTGHGMQELRGRLDQLCFGETSAGSALALNVRHVQAISDCRAALGRVIDQLDLARIELLALDLREALDCLGSILGKVTPDDLLGRIFGGFCIGK